MSAQIKPIRLKHGTVNPARALLLKLNVPQQLAYLSFEEDHNFAERQQIVPEPKAAKRLSTPGRSINGSALFDSSGEARKNSTQTLNMKKQGTLNSSMTNFSSAKARKLSVERQETQIAADELEGEAQTAIRLIRAQFMLHQLRLESGTFFFQWVHQEKEATREPTKVVAKRLYLVYAKDLKVTDKNNIRLDLPKRVVEHHQDYLTQHFKKLIKAHSDLKFRERKHTEVCSCKIQIDLSPKV